jgi:putative transposase
VRSVEAGASGRATAAKFAVSISFVVKLMQRWRRQGSVAPDQYGGWKRSPLEAVVERVLALVATPPDLTIEALRRLLAATGVETSRSALGRLLRANGLTRTKRASTPPSRGVPTSPRRARSGGRASRR